MQRLKRNPEIVWRVEKRREQAVLERMAAGEEDVDEGTVILLMSGMMHQLNLLGGYVWNLCDGHRDLAAIVAALQTEFDVDAETLSADVEEFIADLLERGWLVYDQSTD